MTGTIESSKERNPRVALMAVASNEAAFLPEWIYHHLRLGFSPIVVLVNRTDDNSESLLAEIARHVPDLQVENVDHLDTPGPDTNIQLNAYRAAHQRLRGELGEHDYIMMMDVDEFFMPTEFPGNIQDILTAAGMPDIASFNWLLVDSDSEPFAPLFSSAIEGQHHALMKTTFRAGLELEVLKVHNVRPVHPCQVWSPNGVYSSSEHHGGSPSPPTSFGSAFIAHRLHRSQIEYLAMVGKRCPMRQLAPPFKQNRRGYRHYPGAHMEHGGGRALFEVPEEVATQHVAGFRSFLKATGADRYLDDARQNVRERAAQTLALYLNMSDEDQVKWSEVFRDVDIKAVGGELGLE